ncbi:hypothetical protein Clow_00643 [Corynebacterium lowii]|uniref:Uncharacterized protein n=1 Tax=Corynebacterium lowii TaxID=1544413 RepID=A0A0Q0UMF7_9CORY|nr:hypothetical protein Clow_00643 [Corynebacterium lowii]
MAQSHPQPESVSAGPAPDLWGTCHYNSATTGDRHAGRYLRCRWQDYPYSPAPPGLYGRLHHVFLSDEYDLAYGIAVVGLARQVAARVDITQVCQRVCQIDCRSGVATMDTGTPLRIASGDLHRVWQVLPAIPQTTALGVVLGSGCDGRSHCLAQEIVAVTCSWVDHSAQVAYEAVLWPVEAAGGDCSAVTAEYFFCHPVDRLWVSLRGHRCGDRVVTVAECAAPIVDTAEMVGDFMAAVHQRLKGDRDGIR